MNIRLTAEDVFDLSSKIELAVCGNTKGEVFFRKHSFNAKLPVSPGPEFESLLYFLDETFAEASKRLIPLLGKTRYVLISYERWFELFVMEEDLYLMAAFSTDTNIQVMQELSTKMHELLLKAL